MRKGKITISLRVDDEKELRGRVLKNYQYISREISYLLQKTGELENK